MRRTAADRMCAVARYYDISSKAICGDILIIHDQKSTYCTPLTTKSNQSHSQTQRCTTKSLHTIKQLHYEHAKMSATLVNLLITRTKFFRSMCNIQVHLNKLEALLPQPCSLGHWQDGSRARVRGQHVAHCRPTNLKTWRKSKLLFL